jgi:hypothetical protein
MRKKDWLTLRLLYKKKQTLVQKRVPFTRRRLLPSNWKLINGILTCLEQAVYYKTMFLIFALYPLSRLCIVPSSLKNPKLMVLILLQLILHHLRPVIRFIRLHPMDTVTSSIHLMQTTRALDYLPIVGLIFQKSLSLTSQMVSDGMVRMAYNPTMIVPEFLQSKILLRMPRRNTFGGTKKIHR